MSSFLSIVLQHTKPHYWEETDYQNVRFKKFPLSRKANEYITIKKEFIDEVGSNYNVTEITRIQHPYAYASCQIRRKQLGVIYSTSTPNEKRICFYLQNVNQLEDFLEYNCDHRTANFINHISRVAGPPAFFSGCVVMAKVIAGISYPFRSSNIYPDYVIKCEPHHRGSSNDSERNAVSCFLRALCKILFLGPLQFCFLILWYVNRFTTL